MLLDVCTHAPQGGRGRGTFLDCVCSVSRPREHPRLGGSREYSWGAAGRYLGSPFSGPSGSGCSGSTPPLLPGSAWV